MRNSSIATVEKGKAADSIVEELEKHVSLLGF